MVRVKKKEYNFRPAKKISLYQKLSLVTYCLGLITVKQFFQGFQRSTLVGSARSFRFFIPATTTNDLRLQRIFYPGFYPLHLFPILNLEKEPVFSLLNVQCKTRALLVPLQRLWFDAVLDWGLNLGPPALYHQAIEEAVL